MAPGASGFFIFTPVRAKPTLTAGEYDETLTFRIDAYTDAGYSAAYANKTLRSSFIILTTADAFLDCFEHADFTNDVCGWAYVGGFGGANPIVKRIFILHLQRFRCLLLPTAASYGPGTLTKTLNTGAKTKARIIYHLYHDGNANDDAIKVTVGGVIKKPRALPLPANKWIRLAYNFPVNQNVTTEFWCRGATYDYPFYWIDEIWVIAK